MSPARSSPLPHLAYTTSGEVAALSTCFDNDSGSESHYKTGMHERASRRALAARNVIGERGTQHRPTVGYRSKVTEDLREAALPTLTAALSAGDSKHAIEILWELHSDDVFRYCRRMLANDAEAADVTQKVFEHAIKGLGRLRTVDRSSSWLIGIARHRCLDHARSARRDPQLVEPNTLCEIAGPSFIAEPALEDTRTIELLGECLQRLDARDRTLIELRFYQGLPFKAIAKQLGRTPGALRVRLARACLVLRRYLQTKHVKSASDESPQAVRRGPRKPIDSLRRRAFRLVEYPAVRFS